MPQFSETILVDFITKFVGKYFGANTTIKRTSDNGIKVIVCSRKLTQWIEKVFYSSGIKNPPSVIMSKNSEFVFGFISGLFDGDGHYINQGKSCQINITSATLEHLIFVRNILFAFNIPNSIVNHNTILDSKRFDGWRLIVTGQGAVDLAHKLTSYKIDVNNIPDRSSSTHKYIVIDDSYVYIKIKNISDSGYRGIVYDYEVDDDHSFCSLSVILHNTPFIGGKTMYYQPNYADRISSDYKMSSSAYGSESEYFANAWFPTPRYPLAPLRHFVTDPYHWEDKHYYDRPYMVTGPIPEIAEVPLVGPLLTPVSNVLKPPRRMHHEMLAGQNREVIKEAKAREKIESQYGIEYGHTTSGTSYAYITPSGQISLRRWIPGYQPSSLAKFM